MMNDIDKYKEDIKVLCKQSIDLLIGMYNELGLDLNLSDKEREQELLKITFKQNYQSWYNESLAVIKQLLPDRCNDFIDCYKPLKTRSKITYENYTITDYLLGLRSTFGHEVVVEPKAALRKFEIQAAIVKSLQKRFDSSLYDIKLLLQADVFDSELQGATTLCKNGFYRASGAICGVLIEKHLTIVCNSHNIKVAKKNPTINDFNDLLKNNSIIDTPQFRHLQLMGDLRNICCHNKDKEPTKENIEDLIAGTDKIIKSIF